MLRSFEPRAAVAMTIRTKQALRSAGLAALAAGLGAAALVAAQQQTGPVSVDVSQCVKLTTPEERLACFEAQVEAADAAAPSGEGAAAAASGAAAGGAAAARSGPEADESDESDDPPDIFGTIVELRETVPNSYLITLDNGQVWRQTVPQQYALREGMPVRLYFSRWRAYRLTNERLRGFIQVERVR
jgi:hypothetical protein